LTDQSLIKPGQVSNKKAIRPSDLELSGKIDTELGDVGAQTRILSTADEGLIAGEPDQR
jgi:hypothetical protein